MKKIILLTALFLAACGGVGGPAITPEMIASMQARADQVDVLYPGVENVARVCLENPAAVFSNDNAWSDAARGNIKAFAVVCPLKLYPNSYGIVTFDDNGNVVDAFSIHASSVGEVTNILVDQGWKR